MRHEKVKEREAQQEDEPKVDTDAVAQVAKAVVEMGHEFLRPVVKKTKSCRRILAGGDTNTELMQSIGEGRSLGERISMSMSTTGGGGGELMMVKLRALER